jgi:hypothetical protein
LLFFYYIFIVNKIKYGKHKRKLLFLKSIFQIYVAKDEDSVSKGAYSTLKDAYNAAKPNAKIKLAPDVYFETITIK